MEERELVEVIQREGPVAGLKEALALLDAAFTGMVGSDRATLMMIPGRLIQAARNRTFLQQFAAEYDSLVEKGRIRPDYQKTEQGISCLQELLAALDNAPVDETKFQMLKRLFLAVASERVTSRDDPTPQLIMRIARGLSSGEIFVLSVSYEKSKSDEIVARVGSNVDSWSREIASTSPIQLMGLVEFYETGLMEKKLITERTLSDRSGFRRTRHFRLTDLGVRLCEILSAGDPDDQSGEEEGAT
ncbi:MAG: hypothetical protein ABIK65_02005 [Candidatus Eisenbacteria bacterium]